MPRGKNIWCREHGVHNCPFENPGVIQLKTVPPITPADLERARRALAVKERPENSPKCKLHDRRIQFVSEGVLNKMGVEPDVVRKERMEDTISASGEITYAQPLVTSLSTPVSGRAWFLAEKGKLGACVKKGEVLALIDAVEVGKAKAEFLQALAQVDLKSKTVERWRPLVGTSISVPEFQGAEAALREAQIRLLSAQQALINLGLPVRVEDMKDLAPAELTKRMQFLGLPQDVAKDLDPKTTTANLIPVRAPRDGIVTAVKVATGELVDPTKTLFVVVDNSCMWLTLNVRMEDKKYLRIRDTKTGMPGQTVRFRADGAGEVITGELVWISTAVDEKTRTIQIRADLANSDGQMTASTFGTGSIVLREEKEAVVVPNEAVHWEGDCYIVFVRDKHFLEKDAPKVFHVRTVRPGAKNQQYTEVIAGVLPGEVVASTNSGALRAELLKNRLGEG
jgi:cobalt-zinc-cadmium efflux system membrane fusion protein